MIRPWATTALIATVASLALALVGLPSPVLFGALVGGMAYAVLGSRQLALPGWSFAVGQAIIGVTIGALVDVDTLAALRLDLWPILGACIVTLVLSIIGGYAFRRGHEMSPATGVFAMIAGGASGVTAIARDLGADERVVAVVQYLRVLLVLIAMPVVTAVVFRPERDSAAAGLGGDTTLLGGTAFTVVCVAVGLLVGRVSRMPAGSLLGPLVISVLLSVSGWFDPIGGAGVPDVLVNAGYALIGIQVGLRFTRASLRAIAALLPRAILTIGVMIVACAGLGVVLAALTDVSALDGYLATTPGGLYAVLATAIATGSNVTFVLGTQVARLLVMLLAAPLLARLLRGRT
ncbi:AbrB family transcriptional regulator [Solicola gregarius]|uniref:AbrB family transcriptional regulator n=1 Tax=Solicola gregarius TaxID=2908642 RepID=A0AA46TKN7_9ACTN|nr:AbrB family transcriptional regulator [Solicola gregarius]UYM06888.1 AbrB family transcriptional regulator [Solicola gregarius]